MWGKLSAPIGPSSAERFLARSQRKRHLHGQPAVAGVDNDDQRESASRGLARCKTREALKRP